METVRLLIPSVTALANHLGLTPNAIYRWIEVNRIPAKYTIKVANFYDLEVRHILPLTSSETKNDRKVKIKPKGSFEALGKIARGEETPEQAAARLDVHPQTFKIAAIYWGTKLPLMVETITLLNEQRITVSDAASALGVTSHNVHALRRKWGCNPPKMQAKPKDTSTQTKRERTRQAALMCIEGRTTLEQAAAVCGQSWRTVHRWIDKLSPHISLQDLAHWPNSMRRAYSDEIQGNLEKITPKLMDFVKNHGILLKKQTKLLETPKNCHESTVKRMMIAVLSDEIDLEEPAASRGADPAVLQTLFTSDLRVMNLTWDQVRARSVSFQMAVAELLVAIEGYKSKASRGRNVGVETA